MIFPAKLSYESIISHHSSPDFDVRVTPDVATIMVQIYLGRDENRQNMDER